MSIKYGPIGDPDSKDPFEWAQARMPEGWHVEGQVLRLGGRKVGYRALATHPVGESIYPQVVEAIGYTMVLALANLPVRVQWFRSQGYEVPA